eukprot:Opistho-2@83986
MAEQQNAQSTQKSDRICLVLFFAHGSKTAPTLAKQSLHTDALYPQHATRTRRDGPSNLLYRNYTHIHTTLTKSKNDTTHTQKLNALRVASADDDDGDTAA